MSHCDANEMVFLVTEKISLVTCDMSHDIANQSEIISWLLF